MQRWNRVSGDCQYNAYSCVQPYGARHLSLTEVWHHWVVSTFHHKCFVRTTECKYYMFLILLESFWVLYPSLPSPVRLSLSVIFLQSILPCVLWVWQSFGQGYVPSLPIWDFFSLKLFARQLILLYLWNNTRLCTNSDIILYASDLENMYRSIGNMLHLKQPLLTEINECLIFALLLLKTPLHQNQPLYKI